MHWTSSRPVCRHAARAQLDGLTLQNLDARLDFSDAPTFETRTAAAAVIPCQSGTPCHRRYPRQSAESAALPRTLALQIERNVEQPTAWRTEGPLNCAWVAFEHPQLLSQGWRWNGQLKADATALNATGPASNDVGLTLALNVEQHWNGPFGAKLQEIFLRAGNRSPAASPHGPRRLSSAVGACRAKASWRCSPAAAPRRRA